MWWIVSSVLYADSCFLKIVNMLINRHDRAAYSSQAVHHVAERINELYGESEPPGFDAAEKEIELLTKGTNLASQKYISSEPD